MRLFGERMLPVVSPQLVRRGGTPLATPADLARHVLLHLDDPDGRTPWLDWSVWLTANGQPGLEARRLAAVQALRPGDPGGRRRAGRRARPRAAHRRASARRPPRRTVSEALRLGARLLRGGRAARGRARRRRRVRRAGCATRRVAEARPARAGRGIRRKTAAGVGAASARGPPMTFEIRPRAHRRCPVAVDRSLRAPRPARRARARPRLRLGPPRALLRGSRRTGARRRSRRRGASERGRRRRASRRALVDLEARRLAARRRTLRRDRRRQLPASAAACRTSSRRSPHDGDAALRDVRARQRGVRAAVESRFPARAGRTAARSPVRRSTVVAFEQGGVAAGDRGAVVQRLAAVGPRRAWPPPLALADAPVPAA